MSEQLLICHCSPTLAGIKTANLFGCNYECKRDIIKAIRDYNKTLAKKGVIMIPIKFGEGRVLIYVYRPTKLQKDLSNNLAIKLLNECGYESDSLSKCIVKLMGRLQQSEDFPHEIGLFLGYPPEDVLGFIKNKGDFFKCVGCWKVYSDECKARECFDKYKKCTRIYSEQYAKGKSIEKLTVAI